MKRIILHWTAGAYGVNHIEADAYHFIINRDGSVSNGIDKPEDNIPPLRSGAYAAHTLKLNSYSIGIAVDAMAGAKERPFDPGKAPITPAQLEGLLSLTARLCMKYDIPVGRKTVLTHAEVERTLGVWQRNKWDIMWIPGMDKPGDPIVVGDRLRARVQELIDGRNTREAAAQDAPKPDWTPTPAKPSQSPLAALFAAILALFKGGAK